MNPRCVDTTHDGDTVRALTAICETRNNSQSDVIIARSVMSWVRDIAMTHAMGHRFIYMSSTATAWKQMETEQGGRGGMMWGREETGRGEGGPVGPRVEDRADMQQCHQLPLIKRAVMHGGGFVAPQRPATRGKDPAGKNDTKHNAQKGEREKFRGRLAPGSRRDRGHFKDRSLQRITAWNSVQ